MRFVNQFVGTINRHGELQGLPVQLKLVTTTDSSRFVRLTEAGWQFGLFSNAIFEGEQSDPRQGFTEIEVEFALSHIRSSVPAEDFAYRVVLAALNEGHSNPDDLERAIVKLASLDSSQAFKPSFLATQRAGVISRMIDLGLVFRERHGVRVSYAVTETGQEYLADTPDRSATP